MWPHWWRKSIAGQKRIFSIMFTYIFNFGKVDSLAPLQKEASFIVCFWIKYSDKRGFNLLRNRYTSILWSSGKGKGKGSTYRKVTQRSFIDGGWWMVDILSLMLYIKFGRPHKTRGKRVPELSPQQKSRHLPQEWPVGCSGQILLGWAGLPLGHAVPRLPSACGLLGSSRLCLWNWWGDDLQTQCLTRGAYQACPICWPQPMKRGPISPAWPEQASCGPADPIC